MSRHNSIDDDDNVENGDSSYVVTWVVRVYNHLISAMVHILLSLFGFNRQSRGRSSSLVGNASQVAIQPTTKDSLLLLQDHGDDGNMYNIDDDDEEDQDVRLNSINQKPIRVMVIEGSHHRIDDMIDLVTQYVRSLSYNTNSTDHSFDLLVTTSVSSIIPLTNCINVNNLNNNNRSNNKNNKHSNNNNEVTIQDIANIYKEILYIKPSAPLFWNSPNTVSHNQHVYKLLEPYRDWTAQPLTHLKSPLYKNISIVTAERDHNNTLRPFILRNFNVNTSQESQEYYYNNNPIKIMNGTSSATVMDAIQSTLTIPFYNNKLYEFNDQDNQTRYLMEGSMILNNPIEVALHESRLLFPNSTKFEFTAIGLDMFPNGGYQSISDITGNSSNNNNNNSGLFCGGGTPNSSPSLSPSTLSLSSSTILPLLYKPIRMDGTTNDFTQINFNSHIRFLNYITESPTNTIISPTALEMKPNQSTPQSSSDRNDMVCLYQRITYTDSHSKPMQCIYHQSKNTIYRA